VPPYEVKGMIKVSRFNIGLIIRHQRTVLALRIIPSYVHSETSSLLLLYKISALICLGSLVRGPISSVIGMLKQRGIIMGKSLIRLLRLSRADYLVLNV
jgi:hypothetical protein